jgi:hypothetical protein
MSRSLGTFSARLARVRRLPSKLRIAALGAGLAACSPAESEALALELLELAVLPSFEDRATSVRSGRLVSFLQRRFRRRSAETADAALAEVSRAWAFIPGVLIPALLAAGGNRWQAVIRQVATDPSTAARLSLAKLAGDAADARLAHLTAAMLHDQDENVAHAAERSLTTLCLSVVLRDLAQTPVHLWMNLDGDDGPIGRALLLGLAGDADELFGQAAQAAMNFGEHRRRAAILSALILADRVRLRDGARGTDSLRRWITGDSHASQAALRSVLRWSRVPIVRLRALELLGHEHVCGAAGERLVKAHTLVEHELVLANAHLLRRPSRAARAARIKLRSTPPTAGKGPPRLRSALDASIPPAGALRHLSPTARLGLASFVDALGTTAPQRQAALLPFLSDTIPTIRHGAMRAMPTSGLVDFCFDGDARVAQSAMLSWSTAGAGIAREPGPLSGSEHRLLSLIARSPHESVRAWALQDLAAAPDPEAPTIAGRLAARRLLTVDRTAFLAKVRGSLEREGEALGTLMLVRAVGIAAELEPQIVAWTDPKAPPRLLATAVAALADLDSPAAAEAASGLLAHPNDRVRANAVESLGSRHKRRGGEGTQSQGLLNALIELKSDSNHRVRANAIRAQLFAAMAGVPCEVDLIRELTTMLTDTRPMHRLAALWLAGRTLPDRLREDDRWPELVARIAETARFDDSPQVRVRGAACSQRLAADLRLLWRDAPPITDAHAS